MFKKTFPKVASFAAEDLSDSQVRDMLSAALRDMISDKSGNTTYCSCYVADVNRVKGFFTYSDYTGTSNGNLFKCPFSIDDDYTITLGDCEAVVPVTSYDPAPEFSAAMFSLGSDAVVEGDMSVYKNTLIFKAGNYPDKNFGMTESEIQSAAAAYTTPSEGNINLEHAPKMLRGKLGSVRKLFSDDGGKTLRGEVAIPIWLDTQLTDEERKVSAEFDRVNKTLLGLALTPTPRIEGAALMAAFTASNPDKPDNGKKKGSAMTNMKKLFADVAAMFSKAGEDLAEDQNDPNRQQADDKKTADNKKTDPTATTAEFTAMQTRIAQLEADKTESDALRFAEGEISEKRALPKDKERLVAAFTRAADDDRSMPKTVNFSDAAGTAATGSRVDALRMEHSLRPRHSLLDEVIGTEGEVVVRFAKADGSGADDKEDVDANLAKTPMGRKALAMKNKGGK